jgi:trans-L-3-hydroxyproline dehydratase
MYGVIPVAPDDPEADLAVLFIHNEGYSTMCGHATIALGRWAVESGLVAATGDETTVRIQVPSGMVKAIVDTGGSKPGRVRFESVPSFVAHADLPIIVPDHGEVSVDIAFGGAFYAFADAALYGLDLETSRLRDLVDAAWATTRAVQDAGVPLPHPDHTDLQYLYGTILTDGNDAWSEEPTRNLCVFAERQVDRSPTGSGVSARIAIQRSRDQIAPGQTGIFESIVGSRFTGRSVADTEVGGIPAVVVEVGGRSHYVGESTFTLEDGDGLPGFLLRE